VTPAATTITWNTPAAIVYGTALSTAQLNCDGRRRHRRARWSYTRSKASCSTPGTHELSVTFTPAACELRRVDEDRDADRDAGGDDD
jgi:hypothetical protein